MLFGLYPDFGFLALRIALGVIFLYHGLPKIRGYKAMSSGMGMPALVVLSLGLVESLSALSVLLGIYPYYGAAGLVVVMLGALYYKIFKWKVPFSAMDKMGWEFDIVLLAGALVLLLSRYGLTLF